jgi:hypothetical protein
MKTQINPPALTDLPWRLEVEEPIYRDLPDYLETAIASLPVADRREVRRYLRRFWAEIEFADISNFVPQQEPSAAFLVAEIVLGFGAHCLRRIVKRTLN